MSAGGSWREDRVGSALRGENPTVLARLSGGLAVMGDPQWLRGYCALLTADPAAICLSDLSRARRSAFLESMAVLGEAVEGACARRSGLPPRQPGDVGHCRRVPPRARPAQGTTGSRRS